MERQTLMDENITKERFELEGKRRESAGRQEVKDGTQRIVEKGSDEESGQQSRKLKVRERKEREIRQKREAYINRKKGSFKIVMCVGTGRIHAQEIIHESLNLMSKLVN